MKVPLERKVVFGFAAILLTLIGVAGAAVWNLRWLQGTHYWVNHTHRVLDTLEQSLIDTLTLQTSVRGYVLAGDEQLLDPYLRSEQRLQSSLRRLATLTAENPAQLERLRELENAAQRLRTILAERIDSRRARGLEVASDTEAFVAGHEAVARFQAILETMREHERELLNERFRHSRLAARATLLAILGASAVAIATVLIAGIFLRRDFARRREAEAQRDRFFLVTRDMLCIAGFDGYFQRVNPAWQETLGYPEEDLLGQPFLNFVHPDDREVTAKATAQLARGEEVLAFENRYRRKDGSYCWLLWSARPLPQEKLIVASGRDITRRREADARIRQLNADLEIRARQLEVANKELESFSYSVSHDLRAPLRHIDGFTAMLAQRATALDAESQRYLTVITRAAKHMGSLIDDLLAFSRITRAPLRLQRVSLDALLAEVVAEGGWSTPAQPLAWDIAPLPEVQADPGLLRQAWFNLLDNAVKYSGKVPAPRIAIGTTRDAATGDYVFFVRDNGVGFDMAYADKLFGVFQRLHDPADFEGTGIGLANVHRIVLRHGGRVWAEARVNAGATFYFSLPAHPPDPNSHAPSPNPAR